MTLPLKCPNEDCPLVGTTKIHPQAYEVGAQIDCYPLGDVVRMACPLCNASWMKELPQ